ncbi:hypothetical protein [Gordonia sp. NB41Y]|uniref:hypothetical protein n=1 Tax=Gordonia sp. NB41Y TaxID=875808 RepID=UPI0006B14A6A|nr:hypothetical protein [Gordonia sp. NB41Y]KOY49263.1 hypothetical protein ISGA_11140 [Gordonia sp. NB41Y]WLP91439.1 hypothetical protein Q9K23_04010 [Gordonia sp. NB41Y]
MSRRRETRPDRTVDFICTGGSRPHSKVRLGWATWISGAEDWMRLQHKGNGEQRTFHEELPGPEGVTFRRPVTNTLVCRECGRNVPINLDHWRDRIVAAHGSAIDVSRA